MEYITIFVIGSLIVILGIFNMCGHIGSIHWYHRKNITEENRLPYGRLVGLATVIIGGGILLCGILQLILKTEAVMWINAATIPTGLVLFSVAQLKYNKGFF